MADRVVVYPLRRPEALLARAAADEALHPSLNVADMMLLLCGIGFAVRHAPDRDDPDLPERYLNALLDGAVVPAQS
jgi:hypothetical protein